MSTSTLVKFILTLAKKRSTKANLSRFCHLIREKKSQEETLPKKKNIPQPCVVIKVITTCSFSNKVLCDFF